MNLNEKQQQVVNELDENILLLASAGTGKTETLSNRIVNIIETKKAKLDEILCITFTNKAAKEMETRIKSTVKKDANKITIKTFHSFCFDIIKREAKKHTDIFTDFIVFDEDDCKEIIKSIIEKRFSIKLLQSLINFIKEETLKKNVSYEDALLNVLSEKEGELKYAAKSNADNYFEFKKYASNYGVALVTAYNKELEKNHGLDFNDLIIHTKRIIENEEVISYLREKYKYINIDEVQDTSLEEYSIIENVFYKNNILLCGDIFQTIYAWRGSNPEKIFNLYREKYSPIEIVFDVNYRATKNLTNASLDFLFNAFNTTANIYKDGFRCESKNEGDKIHLKPCDSMFEEAKYINDEIINLSKKGEDISKTCILTRSNRYNKDLSRELSYMQKDGQGFEFILVDEYKFFRRIEIKDVIAFFKLIANKHDTTSLKRIIKRFPTGIGEKTLAEIDSREYKEVGISISDFIDEKTNKGEYFSTLIDEFSKDNIVVFDVESTGVDVTEDEIIQIAAIKVNSKGETTEKFERFIKPRKSVKDSFYIHGFSDEFLMENGEDKEKVLNDFIEFSKDAVIVGHNVQFDINILSSEIYREKLNGPYFKGFYDTLDIYRRFYSNLENHKLETLSNIFKTNHKPTHNAMDDIEATKELLVMAINEKIKPTSLERIAYTSKHIKVFEKISSYIRKLFDISLEKRPHDITAFLVNDLKLGEFYKGSDKIERLRYFYKFLKDMEEDITYREKSPRDAVLEVLKLTSLSNGEMENIVTKRTGKVRIPIITVHQSKGLEYENVFLAGLQENNFPSYISKSYDEIEEEKRTFYVAITRAKKRLYLTYNTYNKNYTPRERSRFIDLLPMNYINEVK